jgi:predicted deacylase
MTSIDPELTFDNYYRHFKKVLKDDPCTELRDLENGGLIAQINQSGPCLAVMSGLHGDERSGPLALLEWACKQDRLLCPDDRQVWLLPLLNDQGWNLKVRSWQDVDLNRAFIPDAENTPSFVKQIMEEWANRPPKMFLDMHEDDSRPDEPYVFWYKEETHDMALRLAEHLQATAEPWDDFDYWHGSDEIYLRTLGCQYCFTTEAPIGWPLHERIQWNLSALEWCLDHLNESLAV